MTQAFLHTVSRNSTTRHHKILMVQHTHHRRVLIGTHLSDPSTMAKNRMGARRTQCKETTATNHIINNTQKTQQQPANTCSTLY